jgi:hypothetical protein
MNKNLTFLFDPVLDNGPSLKDAVPNTPKLDETSLNTPLFAGIEGILSPKLDAFSTDGPVLYSYTMLYFLFFRQSAEDIVNASDIDITPWPLDKGIRDLANVFDPVRKRLPDEDIGTEKFYIPPVNIPGGHVGHDPDEYDEELGPQGELVKLYRVKGPNVEYAFPKDLGILNPRSFNYATDKFNTYDNGRFMFFERGAVSKSVGGTDELRIRAWRAFDDPGAKVTDQGPIIADQQRISLDIFETDSSDLRKDFNTENLENVNSVEEYELSLWTKRLLDPFSVESIPNAVAKGFFPKNEYFWWEDERINFKFPYRHLELLRHDDTYTKKFATKGAFDTFNLKGDILIRPAKVPGTSTNDGILRDFIGVSRPLRKQYNLSYSGKSEDDANEFDRDFAYTFEYLRSRIDKSFTNYAQTNEPNFITGGGAVFHDRTKQSEHIKRDWKWNKIRPVVSRGVLKGLYRGRPATGFLSGYPTEYGIRYRNPYTDELSRNYSFRWSDWENRFSFRDADTQINSLAEGFYYVPRWRSYNSTTFTEYRYQITSYRLWQVFGYDENGDRVVIFQDSIPVYGYVPYQYTKPNYGWGQGTFGSTIDSNDIYQGSKNTGRRADLYIRQLSPHQVSQGYGQYRYDNPFQFHHPEGITKLEWIYQTKGNVTTDGWTAFNFPGGPGTFEIDVVNNRLENIKATFTTTRPTNNISLFKDSAKTSFVDRKYAAENDVRSDVIMLQQRNVIDDELFIKDLGYKRAWYKWVYDFLKEKDGGPCVIEGKQRFLLEFFKPTNEFISPKIDKLADKGKTKVVAQDTFSRRQEVILSPSYAATREAKPNYIGNGRPNQYIKDLFYPGTENVVLDIRQDTFTENVRVSESGIYRVMDFGRNYTDNVQTADTGSAFTLNQYCAEAWELEAYVGEDGKYAEF